MKLRQKLFITLLIFGGIFFAFKYVFAVNYQINSTFNINIGTGFTGGSYTPSVLDLAVDPNGNIVVSGGFGFFNGSYASQLARLNSNGEIDSGFAGIHFAGFNGGALEVASDGKIYVSGNFTSFNGATRYHLIGLNSDGSINNSFNIGSGFANVGARDVEEDSNGKLIFAGDFISYKGTSVGRIARINPDGSLDTSFNSGGVGFDDYGQHDIEILSNGKMLISARAPTYNGVATGGLVRLNSDGSRDTSFNSGGSGFAGGFPIDLVVQNDGKIIVSGTFTSYNETSAPGLIRLNSDGSIDTTFLTNIGTGFPLNTFAGTESTVVDQSGRIILGGNFTSFNGNSVGRIVRLYPNGTYDPTFEVGTGFNGTVESVIFDTLNGGALIGGNFTIFNGNTANRLVRLESSDTVAPIITEVTPVTDPTSDQTPNYTFNTDESGIIKYGGSCSSQNFLASNGNNTITFDFLPAGTYSDCTITVYDDSINASNTLNITTFTVADTTGPYLEEIASVNQPTLDQTPNYTFQSDEPGAISYGGSCSSATTSAVFGNNIITFNSLSVGTYIDCTITVTDAGNNVSNTLNVTPFTISDSSTFTITNINYVSLSNYHTIITYNTSYPSQTYIDIGETTSYTYGPYTDSDLVTSHTMLIDGLNANTTYHVKITAIGENNITVNSGDFTFTTQPFNGTKINYSPDGYVNSSVVDSEGNVYFVGDFYNVGVTIDGAGLLFNDFNEINPVIPETDGTIYDVISDGNGGYFIAGDFQRVNNISIKYLAHINSNGGVDENFNIDVDGNVTNMVIDNGNLYFVGGFSTLNTNTTPANRLNAAAVEISTGNILPWDPSLDSGSGDAQIIIHNNKAYILGGFGNVNMSTTPVSRSYLAAFNLTDGAVDATWDTSVNNVPLDILINDNKMYVSGMFTSVNTNTTPVTRNRLAAFNLTDGTVDATWNPSVNHWVYDIEINDNKLYAGGRFTSVNTNTTPVARNYLATFNLTDGAVDATWDPSVDYWVLSVGILNNKLYAGGLFNGVNTNTTISYDHPYAAAFDLDTGLVDANWSLKPSDYINKIKFINNQLFIQGDFQTVLPIERSRAYAIDSSGNLLPWNPDLESEAYTVTLSPDEQTVYIGGYFSIVNQGVAPVTRNNIAAFDTNTGLVKDFDPDVNSDVNSITISPDGNTVYVGGYFTTINQSTTPVTRDYLAAFDAQTGLVQDFNPGLNDAVGSYSGRSIKLNSDGSILYVVGNFTSVNENTTPVARNYAAAFDTQTGLVTNWNPDLNSSAESLEFSLDEQTVYISGYFDTVNENTTPVTRNYIAAFDVQNGLVTSFNPDPDYTPYAMQISKDGSLIYLGGDFYNINQNSYETYPQYFSAVRTSDGVADTLFGLMSSSVYIISLAPNGTDLYVGGYFNEANDGSLSVPYVMKFTVTYSDVMAPVISEVTPVTNPTNDTTPDYTFTTNEAGIITYGGSCSSATTSANIGNNTITFNALVAGAYSNCTITVTDTSNNVSNTLTITSFTVISNQGGSVSVPTPVSPTPTPEIQQPETDQPKTENPVIEKQPEQKPNETEIVDQPIDQFTDQPTRQITETLNTINDSQTQNNLTDSGDNVQQIQQTSNNQNQTTSFSQALISSVDNLTQNITQVFGSILPDNTKVVIAQVTESTQKIRQETRQILESDAGDAVVKTVTTVGVVATATTTAMTVVFVNPISMGEVFMLPVRLWSLMLGFLGIRRKNRPWGTVYDSITKQPLDPVYVSLLDAETGDEVISMITDLDGRYGFIPKPGVYNLVASKTNYSFPSKNLINKENDELYSDLYFGTKLIITKEGDVINKNIPLDPLNFDWNEFAKRDQNLNVYFKKKDVWLARFAKVMFPIGFFISFVALFAAPKPYNYGIAGLYVLALVSKKIFFRPKPKVKIKYLNGRPASFSIIRFMTEAGQEVAHKVADINGEVFCLITDGQYKMSVEIKNLDGSYTKMIDSQDINVKGGYYADNIYV